MENEERRKTLAASKLMKIENRGKDFWKQSRETKRRESLEYSSVQNTGRNETFLESTFGRRRNRP